MGGRKSNHIRRLLRHFGAVQNWQLILILIPLFFVTATLLRLDHLRMVELRDAVVSADEMGNDAVLQEKLQALQKFTLTHVVVSVVERNGMQHVIFGTGPFYLEGQYLRAANAAVAAAENQLYDDHNPHGNIYAAVSAICRPQAIAHGWAWNSPGYLDCWTIELAKYPAAEELNPRLTAQIPPTEMFRYSFISPLWSPSAAGWAILACVILLAVILIRTVIWCVLHIFLLFLGKH